MGDLNIDPVTAREIVRNLADGVVPSDGCILFSHGRDRWLSGLRIDMEDLASPKSRSGRLRIVNGRNGDGKTHLMRLLRHEAFEQGFLVSYVVVSSEVPLFRWDRVYAEIARNLEAPSGANGLKEILNPLKPAPEIAQGFAEKALRARSLPATDPDFATAVYRFTTQQTVNMDAEQDMHLLGAWLEGHPMPLRSFGIGSVINKANGAAVLRSLIRTLRHFGFPGVLVMIDEVESLMNLSKPQRRESYETLRLLVDGTSNAEHSLTLASTTPPMYTDIEKGLQTYPALWSRIRTDAFGDIVNYNGTMIDLTRTPLATQDFVGIAQSISRIFSIGWQCPDVWEIVAPYADEAATVASSARITMTYSAPRVFVKVIVDMLNAVKESGAVPESYGNMARSFGAADQSIADHEEGSAPA